MYERKECVQAMYDTWPSLTARSGTSHRATCPVEERAPLRHVTADLRREKARRHRSQDITVQ